MEKTMVELFAGVGGFRLGFDRSNEKWNTVWFSQWEPGAKIQWAHKVYEERFGKSFDLTMNDKSSNQDISTVNKKDIPDHTLLVGGFPCFTGDTLILTKEGYKELINIKPGDFVISHDKKYNKVLKFLNQGEKEIFSIKGSAFDEIKTTKNHKFYVRKKYFIWDKKTKKRKRVFDQPTWMTLEDLLSKDENNIPNYKNYYLGTAISNEYQIPNWNGIEFQQNQFLKTKLKCNLDMNDHALWYLVGRYLGDGWLRKQQKKGNLRNQYSGVIICCGKKEKEVFESKIPNRYIYTLSEDKSTYKFIFSDIELASFLSDFGMGAANKKIPGYVFDLPVNLLKSLLEGYFDADGSIIKKINAQQFTTISKELAYGISYCVNKAYNIPCEISLSKVPPQKKIEGRIVNQNNFYIGRFKLNDNKYWRKFYEDGYVWYPITKIEALNKKEYVYDIEVQDSHSFMANNCIVHNCQDYSVARSGATGIEGKKGVLWWSIYEVLREKQPPFCLFENVDRLLKSPSKQRGRDFGIILACLNELGYSAEWRLINASHYGGAQKRKRVFIFAYKNNTQYSKKENNVNEILIKNGFFAKAFPILSSEGKIQEGELTCDIFETSNNFKFNFENSGLMINGKIHTVNVIDKKEGFVPLLDILERNANSKYTIEEDKIEKWKYLKGGKKIPRVTKDGFEYMYSEGPVAFPDYWDKPARTILTSEGAISRTSHVVEDPETHILRKITPLETERAQGFNDNWTNIDGISDRMRYFLMGNALVVPMVTRMANVLNEIIEKENLLNE